MDTEKEQSIIIDEDGIPKYKVVLIRYWELLQGIATILFILLLAIVTHRSPEHWVLWISFIFISLYIFCKRYKIGVKKLSLIVRDSIKRGWKYVFK